MNNVWIECQFRQDDVYLFGLTFFLKLSPEELRPLSGSKLFYLSSAVLLYRHSVAVI